MQTFKATNVFESNKFNYILCKILSFLFITIKTNGRNFYHVTTKFDKFRFIFVVMLIFGNFYLISQINLKSSVRSVILEIGLFISANIQSAAPLLLMIGTFYYRNEYFNVLKNLNWIDKEVNSDDLSL